MQDTAYNDSSIEWELTKENKYHKKDMSIEEYVDYEIKKQFHKINVEYDSSVIAKEEIYTQYKIKNNIKGKLTENDYKVIDNEFKIYMPKIKSLSFFYEKYSLINNNLLIRILKIMIFGSYLACWGYFLIKSY